MSDMTQQCCLNCGGPLSDIGGNRLKCKYCGSSFEDHSLQKQLQSMRELLDQTKLEYVNNQRRNLYDAVHARYISAAEVRRYATEIKKHLPDDFQANFYLQALSGDTKEISRLIRGIDADANYDSLPAVIRFLIASLQTEYLLELNNLVERAYKKRDLPLFSRFATEISQEAEKVSEGIYATGIPRDVFIAYSSKDMDKVSELCEELEGQGLSCFVAARNLRHGVGAVENYDSALKDAMDNCRCFVFVSSPNSRSLACDAVTKEIPYIKSCDLANAPAHLRNNYGAIPDIYKKPRVEYRIGNNKKTDAVSKITDAFFEGHEWTYTPEAVALRVVQLLYEEQPATAPAAETVAPPAPVVKAPKKKNKAPLIAVASILLAGAVTVGALVVPGMINGQADEPGADSSLTEDPNGKPSAGGNDAPANETTQSEAVVSNPENASKGLVFTQTGKGVCRVDGIGTCTDKDLVIPAYSPTWDKVTSIHDDAFAYSDQLTSVTIPGTVTHIGKNAFTSCRNITWVEIPNSVTTISDQAFAYCGELLSVTVPAGVSRIGEQAFQGCTKLESIAVDPANEHYESIANCLIDKSTKTLLVACEKSIIPQDGSVTSIGAYAFSCANNLPSVTVPDGVTSIGEYAFAYCNITRLELPAQLERIGENAFLYGHIETVTVDPQNKTYHSNGNCLIETASKTLIRVGTDFTIPDDGSVVILGDHAIETRFSFKEAALQLPDSITHIGREAFRQCHKLTSLKLPANLVQIGDNAFAECTSLTEIHIPANVQEIGGGAFTNCKALTEITVDPNNPHFQTVGNCLVQSSTKTLIRGFADSTIPTDGSVTAIGDGAFAWCEGLTTVTIPDGVTSIGKEAFTGCSNVTIIIPSSVTQIGQHAFAFLSGSTADIYFGGTEEQWQTILTTGLMGVGSGTTVHFGSAN